MTGTVYTCLHTNQSRSYLNHLVLLSEIFLILRKIKRDTVIKIRLRVKYPLLVSYFISKYTQIPNFMKIRPVGSRVVPCGRTDITKVTAVFCNIATVTKNQLR